MTIVTWLMALDGCIAAYLALDALNVGRELVRATRDWNRGT